MESSAVLVLICLVSPVLISFFLACFFFPLSQPMGLYLAAGVCSQIACLLLWSSDYVPLK